MELFNNINEVLESKFRKNQDREAYFPADEEWEYFEGLYDYLVAHEND